MIDELVAVLFCDTVLQLLDLFIDEFNDFAGPQIDEVVMVIVAGFLVAGAPILKVMALDDALPPQTAASSDKPSR